MYTIPLFCAYLLKADFHIILLHEKAIIYEEYIYTEG